MCRRLELSRCPLLCSIVVFNDISQLSFFAACFVVLFWYSFFFLVGFTRSVLSVLKDEKLADE